MSSFSPQIRLQLVAHTYVQSRKDDRNAPVAVCLPLLVEDSNFGMRSTEFVLVLSRITVLFMAPVSISL